MFKTENQSKTPQVFGATDGNPRRTHDTKENLIIEDPREDPSTEDPKEDPINKDPKEDPR